MNKPIQITWNEYLDEVIKRIDNGADFILQSCREIDGYNEYQNKLLKELSHSENPINSYQSRIDFLNSLKDKE